MAQWLSWLERRPVTAEVEGSSPFWVVLLLYGILAQLGEHLPYKQRVIGSSPIGSIYLDGFPSGQRGQTVNLLATLSKVRILLHPSKGSDICLDLFLLYYKAAAPSSARGCRPGQADKIIRFTFC